MSQLRDRISKLTPEQRTLLEQRLNKRKGQSRASNAAAQSCRQFPLSSGQRRLWSIDQLGTAGLAYNYVEALRILGRLDVAALEQTLNDIARRHAILRTTYTEVNGEPRQTVQPHEHRPLPRVDLSTLSSAGREEAAVKWAEAAACQRLDLVTGPLFRPTLLHFSDDDHVLVIITHHIAFDGWSYGLIVKELGALYKHFASGGKIEALPDLRAQYVDYIKEQSARLNGETLNRLVDYWKERLKGNLPTLALPSERPAVLTPQRCRAREHFHYLPLMLSEKLKDVSKSERVTLFMLLLATFKVLLFRYTGEHDILVGSPIAGRTPAFLDNIGLFVNTLALRTDLSGDPAFSQLLQRVRETTLQAFAHQDMPFDKLSDVINPTGPANQSPLIQANFVLQNAPVPDLDIPGLNITRINVALPVPKFDLTFSLTDTPDGVRLLIEYDTELFDDASIQRLAQHYQTLLEGVAANVTQPISELPLLSARERHHLLDELNNTKKEYGCSETIQRLFEEQATLTPAATALVFEHKKLTYGELNCRANQLAHRLRKLGVTREVPVGMYLERSFELVIALLGILKAGGAYVPLDPDYPAERLQFMLDDAKCPVLITQPRFTAELPPHNADVVVLDPQCSAIKDEPDSNLNDVATADSACYIIYTSGSTGKPKGVINIHSGACNRLLWMRDAFKLTPAERFLQKTPFSFDVSVWEFFEPLICGATLVVARPGGHRDSRYLIDLIAREQITTIHFVPAMLQIFLEEPDLKRCSSIERVVCSGEALPADLQERFFARMDAELHNLYGPTEAAVEVSWFQCEPNNARRSVPIGKPIANARLYVLDTKLQPVPCNVTGELYIGGVPVARGYLNRPELTAERFVPDPYGVTPGARMYKTGDLARVLSDGNIDFLGRSDHQVKIRGFRIELGEIESALIRFPTLRDCVVMAVDYNGAKNLVAYAVPKAGNTLKVSELRAFLEKSLPLYMVPTAFVILEEFPLTASGKVDRLGLPPPEKFRDSSRKCAVEPRTENERAIHTIWGEILPRATFGIYDNFFELGGHSLLSIQVLSRIRERLQIEIPLRNFFESPTVASLAETLETFRWLNQAQSSSAESGFEEL